MSRFPPLWPPCCCRLCLPLTCTTAQPPKRFIPRPGFLWKTVFHTAAGITIWSFSSHPIPTSSAQFPLMVLRHPVTTSSLFHITPAMLASLLNHKHSSATGPLHCLEISSTISTLVTLHFTQVSAELFPNKKGLLWPFYLISTQLPTTLHLSSPTPHILIIAYSIRGCLN
jgi:hypothetical protein